MRTTLAKNSKKIKDEGFTLIEMLVVVLVISILAGISYLGINGINKSSRVTSCKVDWSTVNTAVLAYKNDNPNTALTNLDLYSKLGEGSLFSLGYMIPLIDNRKVYTISLAFDTVTFAPTISVLNANQATLAPTDVNKPESACEKI